MFCCIRVAAVQRVCRDERCTPVHLASPRVYIISLCNAATATAAQVYVSKTMGKPALLAEEEEEDENDAAESFELFSEAVSPTYQ